jgi:hypothetical protein
MRTIEQGQKWIYRGESMHCHPSTSKVPHHENGDKIDQEIEFYWGIGGI